MSQTYNVLLPIKNVDGEVVTWRIIARMIAENESDAIKFAKREYGREADVKKSAKE